MAEIREVTQKEEYNPLAISKDAPFTQLWFYGEWQEMMGRTTKRFAIIDSNGEISGYFQTIRYPLIFSKTFLYIPHGPVLSERCFGDDFLKILRDYLTLIAKKENAIFVRFDPHWHYLNNGNEEKLSKYFKKVQPYAYHSVYFQPKYEWILNLERSEGELFSGIHKKNRYDIRMARNKNVSVEILDGNLNARFDIFYDLLCQTAKRNKFNIHPKVYYQNIFENCAKNNNAFLAIADYENKPLAANLILLFGKTAYFLFAGSDNEFKNVMAPYLLQWRGIVEAKKRGCRFYNFGGVDWGGNYENLQGVSRFKQRFGGQVLKYSDSYDLVIQPFWRWLYNFRKKFTYH